MQGYLVEALVFDVIGFDVIGAFWQKNTYLI